MFKASRDRAKKYMEQVKEREKRTIKNFDGKYFSTEHDGFFKEWLQQEHRQDNVKLLIAPTGSGKTYSTVKHLVDSGEKVIFCLPNVATAKELAHSDDYDAVACYEEYTLDTSIKNGDLENGKILFITYAQLSKLADMHDVKGYYLIIDEAHHLVINNGINIKAVCGLTKMFVEGEEIPYFKNILFISATPTPVEYTFGLNNMDVLRFARRESEHRYELVSTVVGKDQTLVEGVDYLLRNVIEGRCLILSPTDKTLNRILGEEHDMHVLDAVNKSNSYVYKSIIEEKKVPSDKKHLIMTDLLSSGLNLQDTDIENVIIVGTLDQTLIRQFPARLRKAKFVTVYIVNKFNAGVNLDMTREELEEEAIATVERLNNVTGVHEKYNKKLEGESCYIRYELEQLSDDGDVIGTRSYFDINNFEIGNRLWSMYSNKKKYKVEMFYPYGEYSTRTIVLNEEASNSDVRESLKLAKGERKITDVDDKLLVMKIVEERENTLTSKEGVQVISKEYDLTDVQLSSLKDISRAVQKYPDIDIKLIAEMYLYSEIESEIRMAVYRKNLQEVETRMVSTVSNVLNMNSGEVISIKDDRLMLFDDVSHRKEVLTGLWEHKVTSLRPFEVLLIKKKTKFDYMGFSKKVSDALEKMFIASRKRVASGFNVNLGKEVAQ